jgi:hypothetical protein
MLRGTWEGSSVTRLVKRCSKYGEKKVKKKAATKKKEKNEFNEMVKPPCSWQFAVHDI